MKDLTLLRLAIVSIALFFCASLPVGSKSAKPYWSEPKSFWTPANAQKQLKVDADQAAGIKIYGGGKLWHMLTGLPNNSEIIKCSRLSPEAVGLLIRNKKLIRMLPNLLYHSDKVLDGKSLVQADKIEIGMYARVDQNNSDEASFLWWNSKAYCYRPMIGALEMKPGKGTQFNGFIRQMARYARTHRHGVSFYRYNIYSLSPT